MPSPRESGFAVLAAAVLGGLFLVPHRPPTAAAEPPAADNTFRDKIVPFLNQHCNKCHNSEKVAGEVALDVYTSEAHARKDRKTWERVKEVIASGEMPPKSKPVPPAAEKAFVVDWIGNTLTKIDCTAPKVAGRVTLRRLNRAEYNNTVRDLCGVDFQPADDFPSDDVGYGFDNIGDVLSLPPILLEKYLSAADKVLDAAIGPRLGAAANKQTFRPQNLQAVPRSAKTRNDPRPKILLTTEGSAFLENFNFPADGEYLVRARAWGTPTNGESPKLTVRVDGKDVHTAAVTATEGGMGKGQTVEAKVTVVAGEKRVAAAFTNPDPKGERKLGIDLIEIEGPTSTALTPAQKKVFAAIPATAGGDRFKAAEQALAAFARKAFRRPVKPDELQRLVALYKLADGQGDAYEQAMKLPLKAVLASPHFLFRVEDDPAAPAKTRTLNDHELAARLSYFLWSSMPDGELSAVADKGDLRKPGVLEAQIKRMLTDPKADALTGNFAGQWLELRRLQTLTPDPGTFKSWDESLRKAMQRETELFFEHVVRADRSVMEFLDADYTFLNDRLSWHYGVPNVRGPEFRQVKLPDTRRGGLVTHASVLTITSNPTRTSPVKRGKWILENVLGTPPPPPPPDVPELPPAAELKGNLRQQMEQHRANPACANCHAKLDPLGFGLENFDGIGGWRDRENKSKIDATGVLPGGETFDGPAQLRKVLLGKGDQFRRCLAEKLLTYALGRGTEYYDKCAVDEIVAKLKAGDDKFSALVLAVVQTDAFQKRNGQRSE